MDRELIVLGCGTSVGVPMIGCHCAVCDSGDPKNSRTRSSVVFRLPTGNLLVDTSPELRIQLLREKIDLVHAVLYPRMLGGPLPLYCNDETEGVIREAFSYVFSEINKSVPPGFLPRLEFRRIDRASFDALGVTVTPIPLKHHRFHVLGFRIGDLAYCTDVNEIPESSFPLLEGLDTLILDALRPATPHLSHFILPESLAAIERIQPKRAYLTHMAHEMDYRNPPPLPDHVQLAYDGLRIRF
jgi:phosphoribosyl 1,2-cyclic phosphate phosphodiesterase